MSEEICDYFAASKEFRKEMHREQKAANLGVLKESGLKFCSTNNGENLLFREKGKPKVDFYPSTGRWRVAGLRGTFNGGGAAFINWYTEQ